MLLFSREIVTTGEMDKIMPIIQEAMAMARAAGIPMSAYAGANGYVPGTISFGAQYESTAARAAAQAKLFNQAWFDLNRKILAFRLEGQPQREDMMFNFVRGGDEIVEIPMGTVFNQTYFTLASPANFPKALAWANEMAEVGKKITGNDSSVLYSIYGPLGIMGMVAGYENFAQADEARAKALASAEWMPKFLEGGMFAMPGTVFQKQIVKIA
jgi:hypothetical protein